MRCAALASSHRTRCKLPAVEGSIWCETPDHRAGWPLAASARAELEELPREELEALDGIWHGLREELLGGDAPGPAGRELPVLEAGGSSADTPGARELEGSGGDPGPDALEPDPQEPERADFSDPSDQDPSPDPGGDPFEGLGDAPEPELEGSARAASPSGRDVDPSIFDGLEEELGPEPQEDGRDRAPSSAPGPDADPVAGRIGPDAPHPGASLLERHPGPWGPREGAAIQRAAVDRLLRRFGKDPLTEAEVQFGAEPFAATANYLLRDLDPNSPFGALSLYALVVLGPRFAPDVAKGVGRAARNVVGGAPPPSPERPQGSDRDQEPEPEPEPETWGPTEEEPDQEGGGWTAGGELAG